MNNPSPFCTCRDLACPFHPTNHDRGCAPCIAKNLKMREIPSCFFHMAEKEHTGGYTFEDFAKSVLRNGKDRAGAGENDDEDSCPERKSQEG